MIWDDVHDSRRTFLACLSAQCAPATRVDGVPAPRLAEDPALDTASAVLLSLLDTGLTLAASGQAADTIAARICQLTGATPAPIEDADFVLVTEGHAAVFETANRGTRTQPELSATIVVISEHDTITVDVTGPGIETTQRAALPLTIDALRALAEANAEPPRGIDVLLVTDGALLALPRTSIVNTTIVNTEAA